jgi:hypothetical protein
MKLRRMGLVAEPEVVNMVVAEQTLWVDIEA